nr:MAG: hypothetical protein [Bacteriophage sp.]
MEAKRISSKKAFELLEQYNSAIEIYGSTTGKRVNLKACVGACIDVCRTVDDMIEEVAYEDAYKALLLYGGYDILYTAKELGYRICDDSKVYMINISGMQFIFVSDLGYVTVYYVFNKENNQEEVAPVLPSENKVKKHIKYVSREELIRNSSHVASSAELMSIICDSNEDEKRKVYASIALIKLHIKKHYSCYMPFAQGAVKSVIVWKNRYEVFFENMAFVYSKESDKVYFMCFIDDYRRYIIKREVEIVRKSQANCIKGFDKFLIK